MFPVIDYERNPRLSPLRVNTTRASLDHLPGCDIGTRKTQRLGGCSLSQRQKLRIPAHTSLLITTEGDDTAARLDSQNRREFDSEVFLAVWERNRSRRNMKCKASACLSLDDARGKCQPLCCIVGIHGVPLLIRVMGTVTFCVHRPGTQRVSQYEDLNCPCEARISEWLARHFGDSDINTII